MKWILISSLFSLSLYFNSERETNSSSMEVELFVNSLLVLSLVKAQLRMRWGARTSVITSSSYHFSNLLIQISVWHSVGITGQRLEARINQYIPANIHTVKVDNLCRFMNITGLPIAEQLLQNQQCVWSHNKYVLRTEQDKFWISFEGVRINLY